MGSLLKSCFYFQWLVLGCLVLIQVSRQSSALPRKCRAPSFRSQPTTITSVKSSGRNVKLYCKVRGARKGTYDYLWYKNGEKLNVTNEPRLKIKPLKYLKIKRVRSSDSGLYKCVVKNTCGVVEASQTLEVKTKLKTKPFIQQPRNVTSWAGENVTLHCDITSPSLPHVQWLRWFYPYNDASRYDVLSDPKSVSIATIGRHFYRGTLTIWNVNKKTQVKYTCLAGNAIGYAHKDVFLTVRKRPGRFKTKPLVHQPRNVTSWAGENVTLHCDITSPSLPHVQWLRWFYPYNDTSKYDVLSDPKSVSISMLSHDFYRSTLNIWSVTKKNQGRYKCMAGNAIGYAHEDVFLTVKEIPGRFRAKPSLVDQRSKVISFARVGENATLHCDIRSFSLPHVHWLRWFTDDDISNYEVLSGPKNVSMTTLGRDFYRSTLTIWNVTKKNQGKYTCMAGNAVGYAYRNFFLSIREIPARFKTKPFIQQPRNVTSWAGENVTLHCDITSPSLPHVQWLRWFYPYNDASRYDVLSDPKSVSIATIGRHFYRGTLTIWKVSKKTQGKYTCLAGNAIGYAHKDVFLTVRKRPGKFKTKPLVHQRRNVTSWAGENVTLDCDITSPSLPHVQWLRWFSESDASRALTFETLSSKSVSELGRSLYKSTLTIRSAGKKNEGKYTCMAGNAIGFGFGDVFLTVRERPGL